jgi:hypothetical protein
MAGKHRLVVAMSSLSNTMKHARTCFDFVLSVLNFSDSPNLKYLGL